MGVHALEPEPADETASGLDELTAAETAIAERKAGQSIGTLGSDVYPQVALLGALGWVLAKRTQPTLTYDDYMGGRTVAEITRELGLSGTADADAEAGKDGSA
jgi:hypothetical protein